MDSSTAAHPLPHITRTAAAGVHLRPETGADAVFLETLYRSTRETELDLTGWDEAQKQAFIAMQFTAQTSHYRKHYPAALRLIIELQGQPAGRLYLERWKSEHRIIDIALLPRHRGCGLGAAILRDLQAEAAHAGKPVGIHVEKENPAMSLYKRLGFRRSADKGIYDLLHWQPAG